MWPCRHALSGVLSRRLYPLILLSTAAPRHTSPRTCAELPVCLQAHAPELFACGIAKSGAYNRTLTPFGFQAEERTIWQAPEVYNAMSPFMQVRCLDFWAQNPEP